jgi:hypothetical protein
MLMFHKFILIRQEGNYSGFLYKPDGADQQPKPTIIATHGYLNSAEMQHAQAIEL